mmetsp:Transcript_21312/g.61437  ORF Transcript_21312/g.61437 Transcript_21312/m.61437 type:complete len:204 (+) Transcript_21312:88-699(+)
MAVAAGRPSSSSSQQLTRLVGLDGQPQVYPAPLFVKNTFIDVGTARPESLEGFFEERRILSCPTSYVVEEGAPEQPGSTGASSRSVPSAVVAALSAQMPEQQTAAPSSSSAAGASATSATAQVPTQTAMSGAAGDLPSAGSAGHSTGDCKPCVFLHTRGCTSGKDCTFCHLCEAGEKKRRQKEKRSFFASVRQQLRGSQGQNI